MDCNWDQRILEEQEKKTKILKKLKNKYRLVILNDSSFEEKFSYRLSPLNIVTLITSFAVLIILLVSVIIIFTPLREYIPGYTDVNLRRDLTKMVMKSDSLEQELRRNMKYMENINTILKGGVPPGNDSLEEESVLNSATKSAVKKSKEDSLLREYVEREDAYSLSAGENKGKENKDQLYFFTPLKGSVTEKFEPSKDHFGIDIVAPKDEAIKATLDGTVIFAEWTVETGYVIQVQHDNNLTSIYKHNSILLKKAGERVKAGEAIAIVGNSGELSSGPHLHFELWQEGSPIDPMDYINFN